jgi:hypothetical protein
VYQLSILALDLQCLALAGVRRVVARLFCNTKGQIQIKRGTSTHNSEHITCLLQVAAVSTAWSLLGSTRNGQTALYLLFWEYVHSFYYLDLHHSTIKWQLS